MKKGFLKRKKRVRSKISGNATRPRLVVFRSNKYVYAQAIDDEKGQTIAAVDQKDLGKIDLSKDKGIGLSKEIGKKMAEILLKKKIKSVVFDKSGYIYHGKVRAVAQGAREGGLVF